MTVGTKPDEIVQGVHDRQRGVSGVGSHGAPVTNLDVLVVTAAFTPVGHASEILAACVLPYPLQPVHRVTPGHEQVADRPGSVVGLGWVVVFAVRAPQRDRTTAHLTATAESTLWKKHVVLLGRAGAGAELRIAGSPTANRTCSHGNPEQVVIRVHGALLVMRHVLVQRLYGHHLNHDGMVKIQSRPRTPTGRRGNPSWILKP